jgi:RecA-family ATPase
MMNEIGNLKVALAHAAVGLPIFPAKVWHDPSKNKWNKQPLIEGWQQKATTDSHTLNEWWCQWPDAVPGIELGRADLIVIDADRHDGGADGVAALEDLELKYKKLVPRPVCETAGGGEHHYFQQLPGMKLGNSSGSLPDGIDVRGAGGWVVAPGSIRQDGALWGGESVLTESYHRGDIPILPDWIALKIRPKELLKAEKPKANGAVPHGTDGAEWTAEREADVDTALKLIPSDKRDIWFRVGAALHSTGWPGAREKWDAWSSTSFKYDEADQEKTWRSFGRGYNGDPVKLATLFEIAIECGWQEANATPKDAPPPDYKPLRTLLINLAPWDDEEPPDQEWGVYNRFPARQTAILSGEGAIGKSSTLLHLSAAYTLKHVDWLGAILDHGPALFIDCEDEEKVLWRRLAPICRHYGVRFADLITGGLHLVSLVGHDPVLAVASRSGKIETTRRYNELLEMAGDIKAKCVCIASSANVYAGSEIDRSQVQQFAGQLTRIARVANGIVVLAQHPSLTGINTDTGLSGSTQWHNAVRARGYMKGIKPEAGEQPDNDLREIAFKKNQYGKRDETIVLKWRDGMFLPLAGVASLDKAAQESKADDVFLDLLRRFARENRSVSDKASSTYAPSLFVREEESKKAGLNGKQLEAAMRRLFAANKIWNEPHGRPSRPRYRLAVKE